MTDITRWTKQRWTKEMVRLEIKRLFPANWVWTYDQVRHILDAEDLELYDFGWRNSTPRFTDVAARYDFDNLTDDEIHAYMVRFTNRVSGS